MKLKKLILIVAFTSVTLLIQGCNEKTGMFVIWTPGSSVISTPTPTPIPSPHPRPTPEGKSPPRWPTMPDMFLHNE